MTFVPLLDLGRAIAHVASVAASEILPAEPLGEMIADAPRELNQPILQMMLLSLLLVYLASKTGGELTNRLGLTEILGSLLGGAIVGISVLGLVVLPGNGITADNSLLLDFVQLFHPTFSEFGPAPGKFAIAPIPKRWGEKAGRNPREASY
ncbi:MAG: hypothetical protein AAFY15_13480, partial [Cyanobacteria bacterium J06648_11]